ncbi:MAG: amidohydrolase [Ruminococcus sp.]|nr:amidohydrolase [Ruminococcus sp.]
MYIFDSHVHIYPEKIAAKASENIGDFYSLDMAFDGSIAALLKANEKAGINRCLVHSVATTKEQVQKINDFIAESVNEYPDKFVGFGSLHPSMTQKEIDEEICRMLEIGLLGIKLHPDFQYFNIDEKSAMELYEVVDNRMPILLHTGDKRFGYSTPSRLANAAKRFTKQKFIAAHFGGYSEWDDSIKYLSELENVYVDTCSSLAFITPQEAKTYIDAFTEDRVFFATDYPMWNPSDEIERINRIELTETAREKIFYKNICKFLSIDISNE